MHERFGDRIVPPLAAFQDIEELPRFVAPDLQGRMNYQVHGQVLAVQFRGHRIDQERHVVVDDFDDRALRFPAVLPGFGVEHPDQGFPFGAGGAEFPMPVG